MTLATDILLGFYIYLLPFASYALSGLLVFYYAGHRQYRGGRHKADTDTKSAYFYHKLNKVWSSPSSWVYGLLWAAACGAEGYATWRAQFLPAVLATNSGVSILGLGMAHAALCWISTLAIFRFENLTVGAILYFLFTLSPIIVQMALLSYLHNIGTAELWAPVFASAGAGLIALLGLIYLIQLSMANSATTCGPEYDSIDE